MLKLMGLEDSDCEENNRKPMLLLLKKAYLKVRCIKTVMLN